ncbi:hypothetical protein Kpho02_57250 [Kitasatospora phosalacinea]|uniref:DUF2231 domain-containing protein n=1 Tax=Kitasatospora phosalacinea TaxID=2065 RepID=A0A9W6V388_9ACTN|nr:DUF2231 domain-containing protein [Kitasatospora phosalacinea]GLW73426.1 hypothetical protein Kpho02_57250 [Kitasatospora phosalacinea]
MSTVNGLPAHVLPVHVVLVLAPLTALALVVRALRPAAARRLGVLLPALAPVPPASVPLTTDAGEWLERHVESGPLVRRHAELGDGLTPWAFGLLVLAALLRWTARRAATGQQSRLTALPARTVVAVLCVVVGAGAVVDVYQIGDSGAKAAWQHGFSSTPVGQDDAH